MPVHLDPNATTPTVGRVIDTMWPCRREHDGDPLGVHRLAWVARSAMVPGREQVAERISGPAPRVVCTSGGSEASNLELAIKGIAGLRPAAR